MAAEEERRARAVLAELQMRISQGPHAALSVNEKTSAEDVRAAFLQLTKQFHPARFGRMSADVHKLANEVFLGIKEAHDHLIKQLGSSGRPVRRPSSAPTALGTDLNRASMSPGTVRGTGLVPRPGTPQPTATLARGTDRAPQRPSTPAFEPSAGTPRAVTNQGPGARTPQPITTANPRVAAPTHGATARPASASPGVDQRTERIPPSAGSPPPPRSTSPMSTVRASTPPQRPPLPSDAINPPTIRYSGVQPTQALPRHQGPFNEGSELRIAMNLLSSKDYSTARQAFHALAAKMPHSRNYRALLCYARGRETQAMGRIEDAVTEFQRALQLDPDLEIAKEAIRELGRKSRI